MRRPDSSLANSVGEFTEGRRIINRDTHRSELEKDPLTGNKVIPSLMRLPSDTGRVLLLRSEEPGGSLHAEYTPCTLPSES